MPKPTPPQGKQFSSEYQPANRGRKPSIRKALNKMLEADGSFEIPLSQVLEFKENTEGQKDGYIRIAIPRKEAVAMKLMKLAMNGDMQAIKLLIEQIDGRASQRIELDLPDDGRDAVPLEELTDAEVLEEFTRLNKVLTIEADATDLTGDTESNTAGKGAGKG